LPSNKTQNPAINGLLRRPLPWISLATTPSPVRPLVNLGQELGLDSLWLKDDGQSSDLYGGNKVRKLEFLFARTLKRRRKRVMTFGALGSHHCLATAAFGQRLGIGVDLFIYPQPLSHHVLDNLLLDQHFGAQLIRVPHVGLLPFSASLGALRRGAHNGSEEIIPPGGSDPLGTMGYVEGALELCRQVKAGLMPCPDYIYVAAGTCGTAAGLAIGLIVGGLSSTRVIAVQVVESIITNTMILSSLARLSIRLLRRHGLMLRDRSPEQLHLRGGHLGRGYGHQTEDGVESMTQMLDSEALSLEPTYTAKALAGMKAFIKEEGLEKQCHLYWNTVSGVDYSSLIAGLAGKDMPAAFHQDFAALNRL
jgi:1-aminocyclopropane-1-carboxylate deaminase/D-cysteine desulfhydrase-like pyridoxal-dependent ACC family enzyme